MRDRTATRPRRRAELMADGGYITPKDMLAGRQQDIHAERKRNLEEARKQRQISRRQTT
jgi:hypothetical protein